MKTLRNNMNKDGICLLCTKLINPKRRIRIFKYEEETEVSKILCKIFFLGVLCVTVYCVSPKDEKFGSISIANEGICELYIVKYMD